MEHRQPLATTAELAKYLAVPQITLARWRRAKLGPDYCTVGRQIRYRWTDIDAWTEAHATVVRDD